MLNKIIESRRQECIVTSLHEFRVFVYVFSDLFHSPLKYVLPLKQTQSVNRINQHTYMSQYNTWRLINMGLVKTKGNDSNDLECSA